MFNRTDFQLILAHSYETDTLENLVGSAFPADSRHSIVVTMTLAIQGIAKNVSLCSMLKI